MSNIFQQYSLALKAIREEEANFEHASLLFIETAIERLRLANFYLDDMIDAMKMEDKCTIKKYPTEHNLFRRMFGLPR